MHNFKTKGMTAEPTVWLIDSKDGNTFYVWLYIAYLCEQFIYLGIDLSLRGFEFYILSGIEQNKADFQNESGANT